MVSPHSQSTPGSEICHPAGTTPCCSSSGSAQDGADGSLFAGRHHHRLTLIFKSPLVALQMHGSFLAIAVPFPMKAGEAPEGIPPGHPTRTSHPGIPLHTMTLFRGVQRPTVTLRSGCLGPGHLRQSERPGLPPECCWWRKVAHSDALLPKPSS